MAFPSPTAAYTASDLAPTIPEKWAPFIQDIKTASLSILNFATDLSYLIEDGGDVINIPNIYTNVFSVSTQGTEGAGVVDQSPAQGTTTLTVNTHKYIAFVLGDKTTKQVARQYKLSQKYAEQAVKLLLQEVEEDLFALVSSLTTTDVGVGTAAVSDLVLRQAISSMTGTDNSVFEMDEMAFFFHTTVYWAQILGISKYYDKSVSGMSPVQDGSLNTNFGGGVSKASLKGAIYGIPVFVSPRVPVATTVVSNMLLHKEAFAFGFHTQGTNGIRVQSDYLLQNLATLAVVDMIYGVGCVRAGAGVTILADEEETTA